MTAHALLSASSANRWLHCTPSAQLESQMADTTSQYAKEGTLAHALGELKLTRYFTPMPRRTYAKRLKAITSDPLYQPEMDGYTDTYFDAVSGVANALTSTPFVAIEQRVDFSNVVPEGFGTADCILVSGDILQIFDLKYGKHVPVSAVNNTQLRLYALGAYALYKLIYPIKQIRMTIIQPRVTDGISSDTLSASELLNWGETIIPVAKTAYAGGGAPVVGDWCQFCRAKTRCKTYAERFIKAEAKRQKKDLNLMDPQEIADMIRLLDGLSSYYKDLMATALSDALKGINIPGYKVVEGRSVRAFADLDKAFGKIMAEGYDEALLYERKPITLTAAEKLLGKTKFGTLLKDDVVKPQGKPALVPVSDKRPEFRPSSAADDFAEIPF